MATSLPAAEGRDIIHLVSASLDRHLIFPLLEFHTERAVYAPADITKAKLELGLKTNMVDFAVSQYKLLHNTEEVPADMIQRREAVVAKLQHFVKTTARVVELFQQPAVLAQLRQDKMYNIKFLQENHGISPADLNELYLYAKFQYECGNYSAAAELLYHYRALSVDAEKTISSLWGKLACEILQSNWEVALEDFNTLRQNIDSRAQSHLHALQQRTWLIHWGLYIFFQHPKGRDHILDTLLQPTYRQTIQTTCPHILRYLAAVVIIHRRRKDVLREIVAMIQQESVTYTDPILQFLECVYVKFDFDGAQQKLLECEQVCSNDYFISGLQAEFVENARLFIFETYCKIHQRVDLGMLAQKLNMGNDEAERWIVNLIRNASLDAKIDSETNCVVMGQPPHNVYQQVLDRTRALTWRTHFMSNNLQSQSSNRQPRQAGRWKGDNAGQRGERQDRERRTENVDR